VYAAHSRTKVYFRALGNGLQEVKNDMKMLLLATTFLLSASAPAFADTLIKGDLPPGVYVLIDSRNGPVATHGLTIESDGRGVAFNLADMEQWQREHGQLVQPRPQLAQTNNKQTANKQHPKLTALFTGLSTAGQTPAPTTSTHTYFGPAGAFGYATTQGNTTVLNGPLFTPTPSITPMQPLQFSNH
jgi:hypothetical protein